MKKKTQHRYAPRTENKTQPSCKVASCGLRPKSYPQYTAEPIFTKNATRNLCCISVFLRVYV